MLCQSQSGMVWTFLNDGPSMIRFSDPCRTAAERSRGETASSRFLANLVRIMDSK